MLWLSINIISEQYIVLYRQMQGARRCSYSLVPRRGLVRNI